MPKLTDTQAVLLSTASQRADGSLLPPPDTLGAVTDRIRKVIETLIKRALAEEVEVSSADRAWHSEGDRHRGAVITDAGRAAIGLEHVQASADSDEKAPEPLTAVDAVESREDLSSTPAGRQTKSGLVLTLLQRSEGATLAELVTATGWLPHTTRAALTGLRKKGHSIAKGKRGELTCYSIATAA